ncbi:hypothetical protein ACQR0Y_13175 [Bradyrhizobium oligotrophicum]|uniref:hypothetical protein n=1 Tax=Bradyrhizobium oligotrophicum TaxID=44255 RepID=UPI003EB9B91E
MDVGEADAEFEPDANLQPDRNVERDRAVEQRVAESLHRNIGKEFRIDREIGACERRSAERPATDLAAELRIALGAEGDAPQHRAVLDAVDHAARTDDLEAAAAQLLLEREAQLVRPAELLVKQTGPDVGRRRPSNALHRLDQRRRQLRMLAVDIAGPVGDQPSEELLARYRKIDVAPQRRIVAPEIIGAGIVPVGVVARDPDPRVQEEREVAAQRDDDVEQDRVRKLLLAIGVVFGLL